MAVNPWTDMKIDMGLYVRNRNKVPLEYLISFVGKHVAWHKDGTHIVAAHADYEELHKLLREMGIALDEVGFGYVDDGSPCIGAGWD